MNLAGIKCNFDRTVWLINMLAVPESAFSGKRFKFPKAIHNFFGIEIIQLKLSDARRVNQVSTARNMIDCGIGCGVLPKLAFRRYLANSKFQVVNQGIDE